MPSEDRNGALLKYVHEVSKIPLLTAKDEVRLAKLIQKGDTKAREQMIQANLRLVLKMAHEYIGFGLPLLDLISEGNIGLMKAVERFDPKRGSRFSTYAGFWIKQGMRRALSNQSKTIRIPIHMTDKLTQIRRMTAQLTEEMGRIPTDEEIARELNIPIFKITQLKQVSTRPASLQALTSDDELAELFHTIPDPTTLSPLEAMEEKDMHERVREVLGLLDERERAVLSLRFPLDEEHQMTLEEVGCKFKLTRERIRQIQNQALKKLKKVLFIKDKIKNLR